MKSEDFNRFLQRNGIEVFTLAEASRIISKPAHYTALFLKRDRLVKKAARGIYYLAGTDEYVVASHILYPSYVSLISALRFYNMTEQMPNVIYVVSSRRRRDIENLNGYSVRFKKVAEGMMYGYGNVEGVFVADAEKAVIDMVYLKEFMEYAEEAVESGKLDAAKLQKYAVMSGRKSVVKWVAKAIGKAKATISVV